MTARYGMYANLLARYDQLDFTPQRIVDPAKPSSKSDEDAQK